MELPFYLIAAQKNDFENVFLRSLLSENSGGFKKLQVEYMKWISSKDENS